LDVRSGTDTKSSDWRGAYRGQITPRIIVGTFVLAIVAVPLLVAMIDFQNALASSPGFSWLSAVIITALLLAAIVAAIFGAD